MTDCDELTADGIRTDHPGVTLLDYIDLHGEPVHVGADRVVFRDEHGYELNEWADVLGTDRGDLSGRMHELAREVYDGAGIGDPWSTVDPVVFDAETFSRDDFQALALGLRRGCSPAEAIDWLATGEHRWSQSEWARWRGVSHQAVSENARKARDTLGED